MKLLSLCPLLFSSAFADYAALTSGFSTAMQAFGGLTGNGSFRTITNSDMDKINGYACWCYFTDDHGKGRGKPIDEIDVLCKRLHDGYTCAIMDAADVGETCIPWEVPYNSAIGTGMTTDMDIGTIRSECDRQNTTPGCANAACKVEGYFLQQLILLFTHGTVIEPSYQHINGFNVQIECPISSGITSEHACCDEHPLRFPFKTYNGSRDCCFHHTFNTNLYQCCSDGHVRMVCP